MSKPTIILAYSGGLDTSVAIKWLSEKYHYDVIACVLDVGEGKDLAFIKEKALKVGAIQCHVIDAKERFAKEYLSVALQANALYESTYPLVSALSRPLIAKLLVDIAHQEGAIAIAHGCTGKGNDQVRFDVSITALDPNLKIVAPVREDPKSREEAIQYAKAHDIPLPINLDNPFSIDLNLWGRSCECGVLEDPWAAPPEAAYDWTVPVAEAPDTPAEVIISFENGLPVALDQKSLSFVDCIMQLNQLAGQHGVGRIDHVENRLVGIKSREIYEAPAAMALITAHQALESITLPREIAHFKPVVENKITHLIYEGLWFSPLMNALKAFIDETQTVVCGDVRMQFFKGNAIVKGRQSPQSLYQFDLATYNEKDQFNHEAAKGFIELWGLPTKVFSQKNRK